MAAVVEATVPGSPSGTGREVFLSEMQIDEIEASDSHGSFRQLRRKVMMVSLGSALCIVVSGLVNYVFQIEGQLEVMRIVELANGGNGRHDADKVTLFVFAGLPAVFLGLLLGLAVPACGYYGAKRVNECFLCMFWSCSCLGAFFGFIGLILSVWLMLGAIPGVNHWVVHCDAASVCCHASSHRNGEAICDNKTGLPKPGFEPQFRDCILGAHDAYSRKFAGVPHLDSDRCEPTVPLLLHCEGDAWSLGEQEEQDKREKLMSSRFEKFEHEHPHTKVRFFGPGEVGGSWYDPRRDDQARGVSRRLHEELSHLAVASVPDQELRRILLSADEGTGTSPVLAQGSPFSPQQVADAMHLGHKLNPHNKPVFGPDGIFKNPGDAKKRAEELKDNLAHHAADGAHHGWEAARDIFHHPKDAGHKMHDLHHSLDHTAKAHEKHAPTPWKHWLEDQMDHQKRKHAKDAKGVEHVIEDNKVDLGDVLSGIVDRVDPDHKLLSSADQLQLPEQWRRVRIPEQMPDKVPHLGEKWDWEEGKDAVAHSAGNLFSGDEARSKAEAERLWKGGRKQWDDARRHVLRKDRHHHHPPEPSFETCVVNEKALRIMHAVHENLEDLVPKAEFLIAVKLVLSIPLMILAFLGTRWGFRMWRAAKRGYRPTFQQTGMMMQQGPMTAPLVQNGQMIPMQGVAGHQWINTGGAPGFQAAQDGTSAYSVQYPALTQGMAQQAAAAGDADGV